MMIWLTIDTYMGQGRILPILIKIIQSSRSQCQKYYFQVKILWNVNNSSDQYNIRFKVGVARTHLCNWSTKRDKFKHQNNKEMHEERHNEKQQLQLRHTNTLPSMHLNENVTKNNNTTWKVLFLHLLHLNYTNNIVSSI